MTTPTPSDGGPVPPPSREVVARLVDLAEDAILSVDEDHRLVVFNRGAERTFGYTSDEVIGQPLDLLIPVRFHNVHDGHMRGFTEAPVDARTMGKARGGAADVAKALLERAWRNDDTLDFCRASGERTM